jgi:hypothetical protein
MLRGHSWINIFVVGDVRPQNRCVWQYLHDRRLRVHSQSALINIVCTSSIYWRGEGEHSYLVFQMNLKRRGTRGKKVTLELWRTMKPIKLSKWTVFLSRREKERKRERHSHQKHRFLIFLKRVPSCRRFVVVVSSVVPCSSLPHTPLFLHSQRFPPFFWLGTEKFGKDGTRTLEVFVGKLVVW